MRFGAVWHLARSLMLCSPSLGVDLARLGVGIMKCIAIAALIAVASPAAAQSLTRDPQAEPVAPSAATDPLKVIYRVSGIYDNGAISYTGIATVIHCTNYSKVVESLKIKILSNNGSTVLDNLYNISAKSTASFSTHRVSIYLDGAMDTGNVSQGSATISSSTTNIHCTAITVDAAASVPSGFPLHMVRFNPQPGSVE